MKTFTVPPSKYIGAYKSTARAGRYETLKQNALSDYNHVREKEGLPPLKKMPAGTRYF